MTFNALLVIRLPRWNFMCGFVSFFCLFHHDTIKNRTNKKRTSKINIYRRFYSLIKFTYFTTIFLNASFQILCLCIFVSFKFFFVRKAPFNVYLTHQFKCKLNSIDVKRHEKRKQMWNIWKLPSPVTFSNVISL